jgi:hypothetical protein
LTTREARAQALLANVLGGEASATSEKPHQHTAAFERAALGALCLHEVSPIYTHVLHLHDELEPVLSGETNPADV